jgi:hypothetical protein
LSEYRKVVAGWDWRETSIQLLSEGRLLIHVAGEIELLDAGIVRLRPVTITVGSGAIRRQLWNAMTCCATG